MNRDDAERLLELSRTARWPFPSSSGRPIRRGRLEPWVEQLLAEAEAFPLAARALVEADDADAATELAANVWRLWILRGDLDGGRAFLAEVLAERGGTPRDRSFALYGDGLLAFWQRDVDGSRLRNDEALELARESGGDEALALAHAGLARVALDEGDAARAREHAEAAREHAGQVGEELGQAPLHLHAQALRAAGDHDGAAELFEQSLELNRRLGDEGMVAVELHNLGWVEVHRGDADAAERRFAEFAELESPEDPYGAALVSLSRAAVAFVRADRQGAAALLGEADETLAAHDVELAADDRAEADWLRAQLGLGPAAAAPAPDVTSLTPMLTVHDAAAAVEFYVDAFGARQVQRLTTPSGQVVAELELGGHTFHVVDENPNAHNFSPQSLDGTTVRMNLVVADADAVAARAIEAGATELYPVADQPYGLRQGRVVDPYGHHWLIGTPL